MTTTTTNQKPIPRPPLRKDSPLYKLIARFAPFQMQRFETKTADGFDRLAIEALPLHHDLQDLSLNLNFEIMRLEAKANRRRQDLHAVIRMMNDTDPRTLSRLSDAAKTVE
jgi:hypothetical protein